MMRWKFDEKIETFPDLDEMKDMSTHENYDFSIGGT